MGLFSYLKSTILSKVVMAVTGCILVLFIVVHTLGNMQVYLGKDAFNTYAHFLQSTGELIWVFRAVMFLSVVLHIITSIRLKFLNLSARPVKYLAEGKKYLKAKLTSRTMIWTGIMISAFIVYHLLHFTGGVTNPEDYKHYEYYGSDAKLLVNAPNGPVQFEGKNYAPIEDGAVLFQRHDVYKMVVLGFRNTWISLAYILGVILMGFHLNHAIQSMFQTLGLNHPRYFPKIVAASTALSYIIVICLISLPITIVLKLVGGAV